MSVQALSWVIERSRQRGSNLLVLVMIANHANTVGENAYPRITTLADEARLSERAVRYILPKLERSLELVIERNAAEYGTHLYSLPGVIRDGFNLRGLPEMFAGRKQQKASTSCGNLPANLAGICGNLWEKSRNSTGTSLAPEPKRTETKDKNLQRAIASSTATNGNFERQSIAPSQHRRFVDIGLLAEEASKILDRKPDCPYSDLKEDLKQWAASHNVRYFDAWPRSATPIEQAITIAIEKRKTA